MDQGYQIQVPKLIGLVILCFFWQVLSPRCSQLPLYNGCKLEPCIVVPAQHLPLIHGVVSLPELLVDEVGSYNTICHLAKHVGNGTSQVKISGHVFIVCRFS
ncbi:hypothetical protein S83_014768 [Arachis hypogaea]